MDYTVTVDGIVSSFKTRKEAKAFQRSESKKVGESLNFQRYSDQARVVVNF